MMHLGSRRQLRPERLTDQFDRNLARLCKQFDLEFVADPDTLAYYAERVPLQDIAYVLDAKLLTPCGMALTLATEMLTNEGYEQFEKQDCELKAFPRLAGKLRKLFPRTPLCLPLDGLYANQNVIRLIERNLWKYIITFKEGSMPERFAEALALAPLQKTNRLNVRKKEATHFVWITNSHLSSHNVENIANKGGRLSDSPSQSCRKKQEKPALIPAAE